MLGKDVTFSGKAFEGGNDAARALTIAAIKFLAFVTGTGAYGGPEFALLLARADIRLHVMSLKGLTEVESAVLVEKLERAVGVVPRESFEVAVGRLVVVHRVYGEGLPTPYASVFTESAWATLSVSMQTQYVAVAGLGRRPLAAADVGIKPVVPESVYRSVLSLSHDLVDETPVVYVCRAFDGTLHFTEASDASTATPVANLVEGHYVLPGGYGRLVSADQVKLLLMNVLVLPTLAATEGYCFLNVLPPQERELALRLLPPKPSVALLTGVFPSAYTWSEVEARVTIASSGGSVLCHVERAGRLPRLLEGTCLVGGRPDNTSIMASVAPLLAEAFGTPVSGFPPVALSENERVRLRQSHVRARSAGAVAGGPDSSRWLGMTVAQPRGEPGVAGVARYVPVARNDDWRVVDEPLVREWQQRLSGGPPLGRDSLSRLISAHVKNLPDLPPKDGRTLVVPRSDRVSAGPPIRWRREKCPVPGWSIDSAKLVDKEEVCAIPVSPGQVCRYEFSANGSLWLDATYTIPGHRTTIWVSGPIVMKFRGTSGYIWRLVSSGGAEVIGSAMVGLLRVYSTIALREWTGLFTAQVVIPVRIASESGTRTRHSTLRVFPSGETKVVVYLPTGVGGVALLKVSGRSLVSIAFYGVRVQPVHGQVSAVMEVANMEVSVFLEAGGASSEVSFEVIHQPEVRHAYKALPPPGDDG